VPGNPYERRWRCTRSDAAEIQFADGYLRSVDKNNMPCFEPRLVPFWRLPAAIALGIFSAAIFTVIAFGVISGVIWGIGSLFYPSYGTYESVQVVVGTVAIILGTVGGAWCAAEWYKGKF